MIRPSERSLALDIFRGMTICFMIIVNTPGSELYIYSPLSHSHWNGCTPTDLVFPSFLFAEGNAMSVSMKKYELIGDAAVLKKIFKRTVLIFLIGYLIYWFPFFQQSPDGRWEGIPISGTRIMGVLERIALCYCFASLLIHYCTARMIFVIAGLLLFGYWITLLVFGVPGADPLVYMGRFEACDAEGVSGFTDACRCFCLQWACMHTEWAALSLGPAETICAGEYIKSQQRDDYGYIKATNACIKVRVQMRRRDDTCPGARC